MIGLSVNALSRTNTVPVLFKSPCAYRSRGLRWMAHGPGWTQWSSACWPYLGEGSRNPWTNTLSLWLTFGYIMQRDLSTKDPINNLLHCAGGKWWVLGWCWKSACRPGRTAPGRWCRCCNVDSSQPSPWWGNPAGRQGWVPFSVFISIVCAYQLISVLMLKHE